MKEGSRTNQMRRGRAPRATVVLRAANPNINDCRWQSYINLLDGAHPLFLSLGQKCKSTPVPLPHPTWDGFLFGIEYQTGVEPIKCCGGVLTVEKALTVYCRLIPARGQSLSLHMLHRLGYCVSKQHRIKSHSSQQHSIAGSVPLPGQSFPRLPGTKTVPVTSIIKSIPPFLAR